MQHALMFFRSWYSLDNTDFWLRVPVEPAVNNLIYPQVQLPYAATFIVVEETRAIWKALRTRKGKLLAKPFIDSIVQEARDVEELERIGQPMDFAQMFEATAVRNRYTELFGSNMKAYFSSVPDNRLYNEIYKTVRPRPCNCGKGKR